MSLMTMPPSVFNETLSPGTTRINQPGFEERIRDLERYHKKLQDAGTKHGWRRMLDPVPLNLMCDILDEIAKVHPFINVATVPFKATLRLIRSKQDNDKRVDILLVEMIDMMSPLKELRKIEGTNKQLPDGQTNFNELERVLGDVKLDIEYVGNLTECYLNAGPLRRALKAQGWEEKFTGSANILKRHKEGISLALHIGTAITVNAMNTKIDELAVMMRDFFERPDSSIERRWLEAVKRDGRQKYLENEKEFADLHNEIGSGERTRESASSTSVDKWDSDNDKVQKSKMKRDWEEAKRSLSDVLVENGLQFNLKLEVLKKDMDVSIKRSEGAIMEAIREGQSGPFIYIKHPDIRELWKVMSWRLSVKNRHFVMALHDQYLCDKYNMLHGGLTKTDSTRIEDGFRNTRSLDPEDTWCLQYLHIRYLPAISEAFDDDGSGLIRIEEVNDFTDRIPNGWNLLRWIAYWAGSWPVELVRYSRLIQRTMVQLAEAQCKVMHENIQVVSDYMNALAFSETWILATSVDQPFALTSGEPELDRLASEFRSTIERSIEGNLKTVKYNIDEPDTLCIVCDSCSIMGGKPSIEKYLFSLLHILLEKHLEIVHLAGSRVLKSREMDTAASSLDNVLEMVWRRVEELREYFRLQQLDVNEQFKNFACGMYSRYHYTNARRNIGQIPWIPEYYNIPNLPEYRDSNPDLQSPEDNSSTSVAPPYASNPEESKVEIQNDAILSKSLPDTIKSIDIPPSYNTGISESIVDYPAYHCDGCGKNIDKKRFKCVECFDFNLCNDCEHAESPRHDVLQHPKQHTTVQFTYPVHDPYPFLLRARTYAFKHSKGRCAESTTNTSTEVKCKGCKRKLSNEIHFRCLHCHDYDLCETCEKNHPQQHSRSHVLLKLKNPYVRLDVEMPEDEDEERPLSVVEKRMTRLAQRMDVLEATLGARLDELQNSFTRVASLLENMGTDQGRITFESKTSDSSTIEETR